MASLYGQAIGGGVTGNIDDNARKLLGDGASGVGPYTRFGTPQLQAIKVISSGDRWLFSQARSIRSRTLSRLLAISTFLALIEKSNLPGDLSSHRLYMKIDQRFQLCTYFDHSSQYCAHLKYFASPLQYRVQV